MPDSPDSHKQLPEKIILAIFTIALLILLFIFLRSYNPETGTARIGVVVPWGLIAAFISFFIFRENNRVKKAKREERREILNERRQAILDNAIKSNRNKPLLSNDVPPNTQDTKNPLDEPGGS